jgi:hypothetical protein
MAQILGVAEPDPAALDCGIAPAVLLLRRLFVRTFASCDGSPGHAFAEPTILMRGDRAEARRAVRALRASDFPVYALRREVLVRPRDWGEPLLSPGWYWSIALRRAAG